MFWSKLCKSSWNCAWNLAFPVFSSRIVWNMCKNLHYESVYFKEPHNQQEYYWPTIYRTGAAVVSTITSNNSSSGANLTPYSGVFFWGGSYFNCKKEFKELFFRSKRDPRYWGIEITPKKELSCTLNFYSTFGMKLTPKRVNI